MNAMADKMARQAKGRTRHRAGGQEHEKNNSPQKGAKNAKKRFL
jgi:hypothetical protein